MTVLSDYSPKPDLQGPDLRFRISVRRNKLLGTWAAREMGLEGADAQSYIQSLIDMDVTGKTDADLVAKIQKDFSQRTLNTPDEMIKQQMKDLHQKAESELLPDA